MSAKPTVAVIGLGTMGLGIVQVFAQAGFPVLATDAVAAMRDAAPARLAEGLGPLVAKGRLSSDDRDALLARVTIVPSTAEMAPAVLAIEAVVERLEVKQALFAGLEAVLPPDAILATNTSSLSVGAMAAGLRHPERLLGLHFFNPAPVMKLVELVAHAGTGAEAHAHARSLTEAAGKTVVDAPDRPGFIVNRCARPFYGEALAMLEEGIPPARIDAAMMAAGYRLGPFALIDLVGADINLAATEGLYAAMDRNPRYFPFPALAAQVAKGDLGRKTGRGFLFPETVAAAPDPAIVTRIESLLVNEALWLLAEGGTTQEGIDCALNLGLNFPRGPFRMLADHGAETVAATLATLAERAAPEMKPRYLPAPGLT